MTKQDWFMPLALDVSQAFSRHYVPAFEAELKAKGLEWSDVAAVQRAVAAEPEPMTAARYAASIPYQAATALEAELAAAAEHSVLAADGNGGYRPTDLGREIYRTGLGLIASIATDLSGRASVDTARLAELLGRAVAGCQAAPIDTPALTFSRSFDPGPGAAPMLRVRRYNQDLLIFRDDAHVAAWRAYGVPGYEWEAFSHVEGSHIWGDPVGTLPALVDKLGFRGYGEAEYGEALARLVARGWLAEDDAAYRATEAGRALRQKVEDTTDANFYDPWPLGADEVAETKALMEALREALGQESAADA